MHQSVDSDEQPCQGHECHNTRVGARAPGRWSSVWAWRFQRGYVERWDRRAVLGGAILRALNSPEFGEGHERNVRRGLRGPVKLLKLVCFSDPTKVFVDTFRFAFT